MSGKERSLFRVAQGGHPHWVGDGFPVETLLFYGDSDHDRVSPFLLLDYAGPMAFAPATETRGVGMHPHRGFETVTIVYQGEVAHRDNAGHSGIIAAGDVQWMTAGRGIVHEEMHGPGFSDKGGTLEMIQLWVNLPARHKMTAPKYQAISSGDIPVVPFQGGAGEARVIAGEFSGQKGAASTFTPVNVWDFRLRPLSRIFLPVKALETAMLLVVKGSAVLDGGQVLASKEMAVFSRDGDGISLEAGDEGAVVLFLGGEPIQEPVFGRGPFVMNTPDEIRQAVADYQAGRF